MKRQYSLTVQIKFSMIFNGPRRWEHLGWGVGATEFPSARKKAKEFHGICHKKYARFYFTTEWDRALMQIWFEDNFPSDDKGYTFRCRLATKEYI